MELGNADEEELGKAVFFTPITPYKCAPERAEFNSINAGFNSFLSKSSSYNGQKEDVEVSAVIGGRSEFLGQNVDCDSKSTSMAPSTPINKGIPRKKQSDRVDLNERPLKKPRRKRHTPKIFDESMPKKTPKPKIKPSIPKSGKPKASARTKKNLQKDCDKDSDDLSGDAVMQTPYSKIPESIAESLVQQVSTPQPEILEQAILGHDSKSCRRALNFNLENENDIISVGVAEVTGYHATHSYNKDSDDLSGDADMQTPNSKIPESIAESLVQQVSTPQSEILEQAILGHDSKSCRRALNFNLENENDIISVGVAEVTRHHATHIYDKFLINSLDGGNEQAVDADSCISLEDNLEAVLTSQPNQGNDPNIYQDEQRACQHHFPKVYQRRNKTKIDLKPLAGNEADIYQKNHGVIGQTSCRDHLLKFYRRRTRGNIGAVSLVGNEASSQNDHKTPEVLPNKNQITAAMADSESFACVFSLSPMVKSRRKRSVHPKRNKFACRKEKIELEPLNLALSLFPLVTCKRKRSKNCKRSTAILDSICLKSEVSAVNGIESSTDKWPQISACDEIQECSQHEDLWPQIDKSACYDIQECPQHEDLRPRTDTSACNDIEECTQHEDPRPRTNKSACNEILEWPQGEDLWPITESSTYLKSLAALTRKLGKLKIYDKRTYKRRTTIKKRASNNAGQLVVRNPFSSIIAHKGNDKLKNKLPKVELDMESLRVWNQLTENEGEIDEDLDKEKEMWWEEQRKIFEGRVASFIARMRLVLGDRRFSQWKGSVVDSVVGVYLTQNVSDHLSSNAFMLLASAFPPQNEQEMTTQQGQALATTERDSFEREVSVNEKDLGFSGSSFSPMSTCRSSIDESSSVYNRNTSECLPTSYSHLPHMGDCINERLHCTRKEENHGDENTCGRQASVTSSSPEVITFAKSGGDLGNEAVKLPETILREKDELPKRENDWDELRKTYSTGRYSGFTEYNRDSVNWEAVRQADVEKIVEPIKGRGQANVLAAKIKNCLNRLVEDHGSIDLEWLRDVPTERVKEYLLSIVGLGPKSVDCIRLLTLRHHSFPVDINVARIAVRLGWVPLQPLPDEIQMHLLEKYPLESSIQKYLWPRLCKLDLLILYELHYHMITFGKVFCTKKNPNCDACPLRAECRHFASAFASSRLRLPGPQQKGVVPSKQPVRVDDNPNMCVSLSYLSPSSESFLESSFQTQHCEPIVEMPESPEHRPIKSLERDIEDFPFEVEHEHEIPTIPLNTKEFGENILNVIDKSKSKELQEIALNFVDEISKLHRAEQVSRALVLLNPQSASHPARKLKSKSRLRTEHLVYELPDNHPLLSGFEKRELDDPCPYLLAISLTEQVMKKQEKNGKVCCSKELELYDAEICSGSTSYSQNGQIVYGSILVPCRTANRGSFPLNGTYFQVNEVFADYDSSEYPIHVARESIWNLKRRTLYCGTSVKSIFTGLSMEEVQCCFWRGFLCVRGYDRKQRAPRPLPDRFHQKMSK